MKKKVTGIAIRIDNGEFIDITFGRGSYSHKSYEKVGWYSKRRLSRLMSGLTSDQHKITQTYLFLGHRVTNMIYTVEPA